MQIRSIYFCIETCIGENINWKSYNRIIKLSTSYIIVKYIRVGLVLERFLPRGVEGADILGAFHLVKISAISVSEVNGTRFVGSSHWKIPRKSGKSKKVGPFSRLEFPNGMSCSIYVSRSLYQFQVHRRAPRRTGVYDQMEQLFINRKFHFCSHQNFRVFFPKRKAPLVSSLKCQKAREISQVIERLATNSPFFLLFWFFSILGKMRFWTLQKLDCWIALLTHMQRVRFFVFWGKYGTTSMYVDHDRRNIWNLKRVEMIIRRKVVYIFVQLKKYRSLCAQHQKPTGWKQIETFLKMTLKDTSSYSSAS